MNQINILFLKGKAGQEVLTIKLPTNKGTLALKQVSLLLRSSIIDKKSKF